MEIGVFRALVMFFAATAFVGCDTSSFTQPETREPTSIAQFDQWMDEYSNWGRWGSADELGAANLITDAKRREAAALVETGETVSLSHDFLTEAAEDAREPYVLQMTVNDEGQNAGDRVRRAQRAREEARVPGVP